MPRPRNGPETVLSQITRLRGELGASILDVICNAAGGRDKTLRAIELFGTNVLPPHAGALRLGAKTVAGDRKALAPAK